jgi:hypothetical protein
MPLSEKNFEESPDLDQLRLKWVDKLDAIASKLGLTQKKEVATNGGRVDLVWYHMFESDLPSLGLKLPLVGFEIETSWRTRKHIKGDIFNLLELSPALGIILFLRKGFEDESDLRGNVEAARKYTRGYDGLSRIAVWTDKEVDEIITRLLGSGSY